MEQRNHKKTMLIIFIVLIAIMFALGVVFTVLKNNREQEAKNYDEYSKQIKDYEDSLE